VSVAAMYRSRRGDQAALDENGVCACGAALNQSRTSGNDDYDKFSLPTDSGFTENPLELSARRFVTDVKLGRGGPQCFSCHEMERQPSLRWRQPKVTT